MRKVKLYIAISLDGKIAKSDGDVAWLDEIPNPDKLDYGYYDFYNNVDTTLMGYETYALVMGFDIPFPYPDCTNYVFTRNTTRKDTEHVQFIHGDIPAFIQKLKEQKGQDIWLVGGGQINTLCLNAGLIDELLVFVMPIVIGDGIPFFGEGLEETHLRLLSTQSYTNGVTHLRYAPILK